MWMLVDIRFTVTPRLSADAERLSERFVAACGPAIDTLAQGLEPRCGNWGVPAPPETALPMLGSVTGMQDGAGWDLLREAPVVGIHAFLTHNERVLAAASLIVPALRILRPTDVAVEPVRRGVQLFKGGQGLAEDCPYASLGRPAPHVAGLGGLSSLFEES